MAKPTQEELDITSATVSWLEANTEALEPHATRTIAAYNEVYHNIPNEDELEDHE